MSSRRKSRPVRRLDMICSKLQGSGGVATLPPTWTGRDGAIEDEALSPEVADDAQALTSPVSDGGEESNPDAGGENMVQDENDAVSSASRPPEGVYVLQPESVSDDEEICGSNVLDPKESDGRKRSHGESGSDPDAGKFTTKNGDSFSGLDLSVKRPRMDGTSDFEKANTTTPMMQSASPNLFLENSEIVPNAMKEQLEKYDRLMRLVAQQKPLAQAMEEVGLTVHEFFALHRISSNLISSKTDGDQKLFSDDMKVSTPMNAFDEFPSKGQLLSSNEQSVDDWARGKARHEARIQNLLKEAKEDVIQQQKQSNEAQQLNNSRLQQHPTTLNPSMAAALLSLSGNQDQSTEERQEALRKIFFKTHGVFSPNNTPSKSLLSFNSSTNSPSLLDRSNTSKNDSITAGTVSSGVGSIKRGTLDPSSFDEDVFDQYIAKFTNINRCGILTCQYYTRDHYHCVVEDCNYQRFTNKADVIRHYNMHKKRDNSLAHGFLRFSPTEDCSSKYPDCHLNGKSTHYHCMQTDCNKVYTSTSDVMTHENFHKKYMQFVCSGFKRFRATEQCDLETCTFRNQKTTHFHCTRSDCNFTFKNKCDIEKHKTYHLRDDQYISKGFKKYYKNETCGNNECVWNFTANHFHCLRPGCNFSFTSTSQMESHKRKHERNEYLSEGKDTSLNGNAQNSPKVPMFNPAMFQEAAKKILASMPAVSVPHIISASTPSKLVVKSEPTHFANFSSSQSEPVSPGTPRHARTYANYELQHETVKTKEESIWNGEMPATKSLTYSAPRGESPKECQTEIGRTADWPRSTGVISPSMARSAAAALKPNKSTEGSADIAGHSQKNGLEFAEENDVNNLKGSSADMRNDLISKYFAGTAPYKCWISDCDFYEKRHFHCLVENCEAMFTTTDTVIKHAKFHSNLESMGASLPIQDMSSMPASMRQPGSPELSRESDPPPGYIALQSGMPKPNLFEFNEPKQDSDASTVPASLENPNEANEHEPSAADKPMPQFLPSGLAGYPQGPLTSLASQIYATALLKGNVSESDDTPLSSTPVSAYRMISNPASFSALVARMTRSTPGQGTDKSNAVTPGEISSMYGSKKNDNGYIHIKAGMPCLRHDCKYAHQNHWHCTINRCRYLCKSLGKAQTHRQAHDSLDAYARSAKECFRSYSVKKQCPNPNCEFRLRGHYHCLKPGCSFATIGTSKLPWHMKKHEKIARREASGFKYYTKKERCSYQDCKYNGLFSHYHCVRKGCTFAFQYKHQMSTHVRKHLRRMLGRTYTPGEDVQDIDHTNVDSGDDSLPLIIDEMEEAEQRPGTNVMDEQREVEQLSQHQMEVLDRMTKEMKTRNASNQSQEVENNEDATADHDDSNSDDCSIEHYEALDLSSLAAGSSKSNESGGQQQIQDAELMNEDSLSNGMGNSTDEADANMHCENDEGGSAENSAFEKSSPGPGQFNKFKLAEGVLDGFRRYESNESCDDDSCAYIHKVSHYHCVRENCNYRFTGRSHMFKHQQHHDRVAGLVRDDFKRFKAAHLCEDEKCEYRGKNTHFHCLRCSFKCTDSAKVGTHRRQHMKADALEQSGFQRVRGKEDCGRDDCKYRFRNMSHFHCLQPGCNYAIVGLTGIELHAEKHKRGLLQPAAAKAVDSTNLIMHNLAAFRNIQQQMLTASLPLTTPDDGGMAHNLSLQTLAAFREMQSQSQQARVSRTPTPTGQSDNGNSNQSSPSLGQGEPGNLLSKFAFLGPTSQAPIAAVSSPATSTTSISMVSEGVGS